MPRKNAAAANEAVGPRCCPILLPELLASIHDRLGLIDRIAFAAVFAASCDGDLFKPSAPWLLLPGKTTETAELFSVADRRATTVRAPDPALRGHFVVLGSSRGWLAMADDLGQIYLVNPATGEQQELPHITTMGVFLDHRWPNDSFSVHLLRFLTIRYGRGPPFPDSFLRPGGYGTYSFSPEQMFYRKVVLSPCRPGSYGTAMLILERLFGAPAFATAEAGVWKLARSEDGVEDAIHHDGQFYSISYSGVVEAWQRDPESGQYKSTAVASRLTIEEGSSTCPLKYLAVAPDGRLMVVLKYGHVTKKQYGQGRWTCSFKVHVLGDDGQWNETRDIGHVAPFIGVNNSLCVPTRGRPEIEAGCIYFTDDRLGDAMFRFRNELSSRSHGSEDDDESDVRSVGVYSLKDGTMKKMEALEQEYRRCRFLSPPPVWIMPSIP
ncbi:unnamed protein product [Triticum turgidum subsp. durum]|uniref:KIB1-4 beta-propeller domain-containing protein n=1 Tax=Triticum turgidum subsp. durum TaxID=4567 RepID=A0A9R0QM33_TRITD|nr:unnamed protein product [Triticum turgidum subsp. durum]